MKVLKTSFSFFVLSAGWGVSSGFAPRSLQRLSGSECFQLDAQIRVDRDRNSMFIVRLPAAWWQFHGSSSNQMADFFGAPVRQRWSSRDSALESSSIKAPLQENSSIKNRASIDSGTLFSSREFGFHSRAFMKPLPQCFDKLRIINAYWRTAGGGFIFAKSDFLTAIQEISNFVQGVSQLPLHLKNASNRTYLSFLR